MSKYYSLMLSQNISKTPEGYLICENVPLCRSGFQEYKGSELVGFPGYEEDWGLEPETRYKVYRPKEAVLDPEFIKSLEGKTVVDEHPDGSVVHSENDGELNCGHLQRVGKGDEVNGEVTLKGDIHIKSPELIQKVRPEEDPNASYAVRDVSLGYSLHLKRLDDGTIVMTHLRGNHCAIVEKGRAGPMIAIGDASLPEEVSIPVKPEIKPKKEYNMSLMDKILGLGWKAYATDASPEEVAMAAKEMGAKPPAETKEDTPHMEHMSAVKDYCDKGGDKDALMSFLKGEHKPAHDASETLEELQEETGNKHGEEKTDGEEEQPEKTPAEEDDKMATDFDDIDNHGDSVLKQANDSAREFIKSTKPIVAAIIAKPKAQRSAHEQTMVDSYNSTVKSVNKAGGRAYTGLAKVKSMEKVVTDSSSITKQTEHCNCFEGVPYKVGLKKHEAHLAQKGNK